MQDGSLKMLTMKEHILIGGYKNTDHDDMFITDLLSSYNSGDPLIGCLCRDGARVPLWHMCCSNMERTSQTSPS